MDHQQDVTFVVRKLFNHIRRITDSDMPPEKRITPMQGRVIGFVKHHPGNTYQRDLECEFQIRRSTASTILQTMEKADLIRREPVPQDARLKKLVLTPKAEAFDDYFLKKMKRVEAILAQGVSQDELDAFFRIASKFENNLKEYFGTCAEAPCRERNEEGKE